MELIKLKHYLHRVGQLGLHQSVQVIHNRCKNYFFDVYWRKKAAHKKAHHSWKSAAQKMKLNTSWPVWFLAAQKRISLSVDELYLEKNLRVVTQEADSFVDNFFDLLGSGKQQFNHIPWHTDFRLQAQNQTADSLFEPDLYYKDFVIAAGATESLVKDIKIPWEISRLQHFFVLGYAYQQTDDIRYKDAFEKHFLAWRKDNQFLLGSHWACPMDVAIRAVNLVWAFILFQDSLSSEFCQEYAAVLYDHFFYLENNWEVYDFRTSNHYLSDLIGYFYLCYFFYDSVVVQEKAAWCYKELLQEFEKQIFQEGTDYEGSTAYHQLITEIFYHFSLLAKKMGFFTPKSFEEKLKKMFMFIDWCTPTKGTLVHIGDNDSGKILYYGVTEKLVEMMREDHHKMSMHFKEFGLSILKTNSYHITLRHHAYNTRQPSGHFHVDVGSVTVALEGVSLIVDPGSFVYTPSGIWRNRFRSVAAHSTFYKAKKEPIAVDNRLFLLNLPEENMIIEESNECIVAMKHRLYQHEGITAHRSVQLADADTLIISDWIDTATDCSHDEWCWHFVLNPDVLPRYEQGKIILEYQKKPFAMMASELEFEVVDCFVSPHYGMKVPSKKLKALKKIDAQKKIITTITKL